MYNKKDYTIGDDTMNVQKTCEQFRTYLDRIKALQNASSLLHWDAATGAPRKAVDDRSKTIGILAAEIFSLATSEDMHTYLTTLEPSVSELDPITAALVRECRKDYDKMTKIPADEYKAYSELCAKSMSVWEDAKEASDFSMFAPLLEKIVDYNRKFVQYRGHEGHPYNTLLDDYEPGITVEKLDAFFGVLREKIVPLVKKIAQSTKQIRTDFTSRSFSVEQQKAFSLYVLEKIGYDLDAGMLKESAHPFTLGFSPNDIRITTHYYPENFTSAIFSTVHEAGHAIYEQNVDQDLAGTLLSEGTSMGIHESQSRFYENILGRSLGFWKYFYPKLQELFSEQLKDVSIEQLHEAVNHSTPSLIRIEADELTYSLHVMVRYEIEKALLEGQIQVKDLPSIWNQKMEEYLGITPKNDKEGVLQDVHWSDGMFGYFPSYALGNAYGAQFVHSMKKELDLEKLVTEGQFEPIKTWLRENIHRHGKMLSPNEIIQKVTGEDLNPLYFTQYLEEKYTQLYGL